MVRHYGELIVWQKAMDFVEYVYEITNDFPTKEMFGLTNQLRRAAVSIPSNIAEGQGRGTTRGFLHFLAVARGSLQEVETQVLIAFRLKYLAEDSKANLVDRISEIGRLLSGLSTSLNRLAPSSS